MTLVIEIDMKGAAFDGQEGTECARLLDYIAKYLPEWDGHFNQIGPTKLRDSNCNLCGFVRVEET